MSTQLTNRRPTHDEIQARVDFLNKNLNDYRAKYRFLPNTHCSFMFEKIFNPELDMPVALVKVIFRRANGNELWHAAALITTGTIEQVGSPQISLSDEDKLLIEKIALVYLEKLEIINSYEFYRDECDGTFCTHAFYFLNGEVRLDERD